MAEPSSDRERGAAAVIAVGGILAVVGSILPWISATAAFAGSISKNGLEGGDGVVTLILGVVGVLVGAAVLFNFELPGLLAGSAVVQGIIVGGIAFVNHQDIRGRVDDFQEAAGAFGVASIGAGIWVLYVGAVLLIVGGAVLTRERGAPATGRADGWADRH